MRLVPTLLALSLAGWLAPAAFADSEEQLGRFIADQADQGVSGTALADAVEAHCKGHARTGDHADGAAPTTTGDDDHGHAHGGGPDYRGLGKIVQALLAKGLRGEELAKAIHAELAARHLGKGHGKPGGDRKPARGGAGGDDQADHGGGAGDDHPAAHDQGKPPHDHGKPGDAGAPDAHDDPAEAGRHHRGR